MTKSTRGIQNQLGGYSGMLVCLYPTAWKTNLDFLQDILLRTFLLRKRGPCQHLCAEVTLHLSVETMLQEGSSQFCGVKRRAIPPTAQISMCKSISGSESFTLQLIKNRAAKDKELTRQQTKIHKDSEPQYSGQNLTLSKVQHHSALGFSSRPNLGKGENERSHYVCPLHGKTSSTHHVKCFVF